MSTNLKPVHDLTLFMGLASEAMSALADYIQAARMLNYHQRNVG